MYGPMIEIERFSLHIPTAYKHYLIFPQVIILLSMRDENKVDGITMYYFFGDKADFFAMYRKLFIIHFEFGKYLTSFTSNYELNVILYE